MKRHRKPRKAWKRKSITQASTNMSHADPNRCNLVSPRLTVARSFAELCKSLFRRIRGGI